MTDRSLPVVLVAVFGLALGLRLLPLAWSPYPATLDGIGYAALARDTLAAGQFPFASMRADNPVFTGFLATTGAVLGIAPLRVAQPTVAVVGAASVLAAMAIVRRFAHDLAWRATSVRLATVVVGLGLAVDGLYLRRTGVPDEEALAFLLLPLLILALHRGLRSTRLGWLLPAGILLVTFPLLHTFSTLVAGTTLVAWLVAARRHLSTRRLAVAAGLVGAFWLYFATYYSFTARLGFTVPYVDRVTAHPGLFLAWLVAMAIGVWWYRSAGRPVQIAIVIGPVLIGLATVLVNVVTPVFPATVSSPTGLSALLLLYLLPVGVGATFAAHKLADRREGAVLLLGLLAAPVTIVGFALTAALTPEFFGTVMRTQTFAHLPFVALAAIAVGGLALKSSRSVGWGPGLAAILLAALLVTAPIAYVDLDTLAFPSTTTESEFQAAAFAAQRIPGTWTSDHVLTRIGAHYYESSQAIGPTAAWLGSGLPPPCPTLVADSWTTSGAHLFPAGPATMDAAAFDRTIAARHRVYSSGDGYDAFTLSLPTGDTSPGC